MYVDIVISNIFNLNKHFFFSFSFSCGTLTEREKNINIQYCIKFTQTVASQLLLKKNKPLTFVYPFDLCTVRLCVCRVAPKINN